MFEHFKNEWIFETLQIHSEIKQRTFQLTYRLTQRLLHYGAGRRAGSRPWLAPRRNSRLTIRRQIRLDELRRVEGHARRLRALPASRRPTTLQVKGGRDHKAAKTNQHQHHAESGHENYRVEEADGEGLGHSRWTGRHLEIFVAQRIDWCCYQLGWKSEEDAPRQSRGLCHESRMN